MILYILGKAVILVLNILLSAIGTFGLDTTQITNALSIVADYIFKANYFFPIDTVFTILGLYFYVETMILAFKFGTWTLRRLRMLG